MIATVGRYEKYKPIYILIHDYISTQTVNDDIGTGTAYVSCNNIRHDICYDRIPDVGEIIVKKNKPYHEFTMPSPWHRKKKR
jgi:hypothetical protein